MAGRINGIGIERGGQARAGAFGVSAGDGAGQVLRTMLALMAMPLALALMLHAEMIAEAVGRFGG